MYQFSSFVLRPDEYIVIFSACSLYTFDMRKLSAPVMMHMDHVAAGKFKNIEQDFRRGWGLFSEFKK